jgi:hypothetical protein
VSQFVEFLRASRLIIELPSEFEMLQKEQADFRPPAGCKTDP